MSSRAKRGISAGQGEAENGAAVFRVHIGQRTSRAIIGVTNNLERRLFEHRSGITPGVATRYRANRLVYFETTENPLTAIEREKKIKGWRRSKKIELIEQNNAHWRDLSRDW